MAELHKEQTGRRVIASYRSYAEAQRAVDHLADQEFPVQHVQIIGEGLYFREQVTGRKGYGTAAASGATTGALLGAVLGFLFGLFSLVDPLVTSWVLALWGIVIGAVAGAILGLLGHAFSGGRRDFSAIESVAAHRYDVVVEEPMADEAARLLQDLAASR